MITLNSSLDLASNTVSTTIVIDGQKLADFMMTISPKEILSIESCADQYPISSEIRKLANIVRLYEIHQQNYLPKHP